MKDTKRKPRYAKKRKVPAFVILTGVCLVLLFGMFLMSIGSAEEESTAQPPVSDGEKGSGLLEKFFALFAPADNVKETDAVTYGIDVAKYQGTIDWEAVAASGVDFAMIRVGYRTQVDGEIIEDSNARYNLQEASRQEIPMGAYFFSTAVTVAEAREEAAWVAELISRYPITYPVAYNCEGFQEPDNRQHSLSVAERTDIALAFLEAIEEYGYEAMFYASKNEMEADILWEVSRIETDYKIWVAQYPDNPDPENSKSSYSGQHHMWQYTREGSVSGITQGTDLDVAYFGYDGIRKPKNPEAPAQAKPDPEALMAFQDVNESVTAKEAVNLRSIPSQDEISEIVYQLQNGEVAQRTGISDSGWSRVEYEGQICYAVSGFLTTDLSYQPTQPQEGVDPFAAVEETVTAKELVNLRSAPSTVDGESEVVGQLKNGETVKRTGVSDNGWSRLEYNGEICYAVSSYLTTVTGGSEPDEIFDGVIDTVFTEINDRVTAKELVNLRSIPSVEDPASQVIAQLKHGEVITRTGINEDVGWSRVDYNGQILYCISSYLEPAE